MNEEIWISLACGFGGLTFLMMFFRAVQTKWPESYFAISDVTSYRISTTPLRYGLFRFAPVIVVSFFTATVAESIKGSSLVAVAALGVTHVVLSSGLAFVRAVRKPITKFARSLRLLYFAVVSVGIAASSVFGWALSLSPDLRRIVPESADLSTTVWTAAFAGIIGAFLLAVSRGEAPSTRQLLTMSRSTLSKGLWAFIEEEAKKQRADVWLVQAVALTENLQRPSWFRRLERMGGNVLGRGTYGVMQVSSDGPIDDQESVRLAIRKHFAGTQRQGLLSYDEVLTILKVYNPDKIFSDLARDIYHELVPPEAYEYVEDDEDELDDSELEGSPDLTVLAFHPKQLRTLVGVLLAAVSVGFAAGRGLRRRNQGDG